MAAVILAIMKLSLAMSINSRSLKARFATKIDIVKPITKYAVVVNDGVIEKAFIEDGYQDNAESDPYEISTPENLLENL